MTVCNDKRTAEDVYQHTSRYWPAELKQRESEESVIPMLLETQDTFIALLSLKFSNYEDLFSVVEKTELAGNLFLKHLVVLADYGGEPLQRLNSEFNTLFPARELTYSYDGAERSYAFKSLPIKQTLSNPRLEISAKKLIKAKSLSSEMQDVAMILMFGGACTDETVAEKLAKCEISNYLGKKEELETFVKQRYIWVSRITQGATVNALGHLVEDAVHDYLTDHLDIPNVTIKRSGTVPGVQEREGLTAFDIVVSLNEEKYVAIEVMFQVTTNSVIERKGSQAKSRYEEIEKNGFKIAYVIGGTGSFQRETAVANICKYSHYAVGYSPEEFEVLRKCIRDYLLSD